MKPLWRLKVNRFGPNKWSAIHTHIILSPRVTEKQQRVVMATLRTCSFESTWQLVCSYHSWAIPVILLVNALQQERTVCFEHQDWTLTQFQCTGLIYDFTLAFHLQYNTFIDLTCHFLMLFQRYLNSWKPSLPVLSLCESWVKGTTTLSKIYFQKWVTPN